MNLPLPRRWPHVLVVDGPRWGGIGPGDQIPVELGHVISLGTSPWVRDQPREQRQVLSVSARDVVRVPNTPGFRIVDDPARVERSTDAIDPREWKPFDAQQPITFDGYTLRFILDGPVLGTVRRFGDHVVCSPRPRGGTRHGTCATSEWRIAKKAAHEILVVEELFDGTIRWETRSAPMGRRVSDLRDAVARARDPQSGNAPLDKEIAAGIAMQLSETHAGEFIVGYDGIARARDTWRLPGRRTDARAFAYLKLTHPWRWDWENKRPSPEELAKVQPELARIEPASIDAIAAMMRALYPEDAARTAAIVEECGLI